MRAVEVAEGLVDEQRYNDVLAQLEYQAGQAEVWRDAVNVWFRAHVEIADAKAAWATTPAATEAETMTLAGYTVRDVNLSLRPAAPAARQSSRRWKTHRAAS